MFAEEWRYSQEKKRKMLWILMGDVLKLKNSILRQQRMGSTPCGSRFPAEMSGLWTPDHDRKKTVRKNVKEIVEKS